MSETSWEHDDVSDQSDPSDLADRTGAPAPEPTGHDAVDRVVASLRDLDERPVEEHVAVFEQAHETLRRALAEASDPVAALRPTPRG